MHWSNLVSAWARQLPRQIHYAFIHSLQELRPCVFLGRTTFTQLIRELLVFYGTKIFISLFYSLDHIQLNTVHTIMTYLLHPIHLAFICAIQQSNNIGVCSDGLCIVSSTEVVLLSIGVTANYMLCATSTTADRVSRGIWCGGYVIRSYSRLVLLIFLKLEIPTWLMFKFVRWEDDHVIHYSIRMTALITSLFVMTSPVIFVNTHLRTMAGMIFIKFGIDAIL